MEETLKKLHLLKKNIEANKALSLPCETLAKQLWNIIHREYPAGETGTLKNHPDFSELAHFFRDFWSDFFSDKELSLAKSIITENTENSVYRQEKYSELFSCLCPYASQRDYTQIHRPDENEFTLISPDQRKGVFTMLGCGAYPATLLSACKADMGFSHFASIDRDSESVRLAQAIYTLSKRSNTALNVAFYAVKAEEYDYSNTNVVFISLGLLHKAAVARQIINTLPAASLLVIRNPVTVPLSLVFEDIMPELQRNAFRVQKSIAMTRHWSSYALTRMP